MNTSPSTQANEAFHIPTVFDLDISEQQGTSASTIIQSSLHSSLPWRWRSEVPNAEGSHSCSATPSIHSTKNLLDDLVFTYTGFETWGHFLRIQSSGVELYAQLQQGATFSHEAVQPCIPKLLQSWAVSLNNTRDFRGSTALQLPTISRVSSSLPLAVQPQRPTSISGQAEAEEYEEEAFPPASRLVLPPWSDLPSTKRCDGAGLHRLRAAVNTYCCRLLDLLSLAERYDSRWGRLRMDELHILYAAMAAEKATRVQTSLLFSTFSELDFSQEKVQAAGVELGYCTHVQVLQLNGNRGLTELYTLPPQCQILSACGCQLEHFLTGGPSPVVTLPCYPSLMVLGLAHNNFSSLDFLCCLPSLRLLDISYNRLSSLTAVTESINATATLVEIVATGNPIALLDGYRTFLAQHCTQLERLDGATILPRERVKPVPSEPAAANASGSSWPAATDGKRRGSASTTRTHHSAATSGAMSVDAKQMEAEAVSSMATVSLQTVMVGMEIVSITGLRSFHHQQAAIAMEDLLPSSPYVYELAGLPSNAALPEMASSRGSNKKSKSSRGGAGANSRAGPAGYSAKQHTHPLYQLTSKLIIRGVWGGDEVVDVVAATPQWSTEPSAVCDALSISLDVELEAPPAAANQRGNRGATGPSTGIAAASGAGGRSRKAAATANTSSNGSGGAVADPWYPGQSVPKKGSFTATLPVTSTLQSCLQKPLRLLVEVEDTFRCLSTTDLRAALESTSGNRTGGTSHGSHASSVVSTANGSPPNLPSTHGKAAVAEEESVLPGKGVIVDVVSAGAFVIDPYDLFRRRDVSSDTPPPPAAPPSLSRSDKPRSKDAELVAAAAAAAALAAAQQTIPLSRILYVHGNQVRRDDLEVCHMRSRLQREKNKLADELQRYTSIQTHISEVSRSETDASPSPLKRDDYQSSGTALRRSGSRHNNLQSTTDTSGDQHNGVTGNAPVSLLGRAGRLRQLSTSFRVTTDVQRLYDMLKSQQIRVVQQAIFVAALQARCSEYAAMSLELSARMCIGRGAAPAPVTPADVELEALRKEREKTTHRGGKGRSGGTAQRAGAK